ncbi:large ribosomal subunit protein uL13m-like [Lineus longissimus]|uniref:large ribosomal subunit protein uL13m-like n=1 Tax=Lineus longissimus TaxID=88925 RepID=UPI002B4DB437
MSHWRVQQWATMARTWWLYDMNHQCPLRSADKIATYLSGKNKPIYYNGSDVGDHVVVINTKHLALFDDEWKMRVYTYDTGYPGGKSEVEAWKVHLKAPTEIVYKAIKSAIVPKDLGRPTLLKRLHLFPEKDVPPEIMKNVSDQIKQIMPVPKRLDEYSQEEVDKFPKLFDWPEDYEVKSGHKYFKRGKR